MEHALNYPVQEALYQFSVAQENSESLSLILSIQTGGTTLSLLGLTPSGQRIFEAHNRNGQYAERREPYCPKNLRLSALYGDISAIFATSDSLQELLSDQSAKFKEHQGIQRTIIVGRKVVMIQYQDSGKTIVFNNQYLPYQFYLRALQN